MHAIDFQEDKLHEECGVFGMYSHRDDVALNTYWGLFALQHRGQESAGIAVTDGRNMHIKKGMGLATEVFKSGLAGLDGYIGIGHVRYSTTGSSMVYNVQPMKVFYDGGNLALSHNGNLTNAGSLRQELQQEGFLFSSTVDSEVVLHLIARSRKKTLPERVAEAANSIKGAFAILVMDDHQLVAFRDPYGFRPLCISKMDHGWVVTSAMSNRVNSLSSTTKKKSRRASCTVPTDRLTAHTASLNTFILPVPTASWTERASTKPASTWAGSWPGKRRISTRIS